jgi:hypothetical protein
MKKGIFLHIKRVIFLNHQFLIPKLVKGHPKMTYQNSQKKFKPSPHIVLLFNAKALFLNHKIHKILDTPSPQGLDVKY